MGQDTSVFHQELSSAINEQALERFGKVSETEVEDFFGHEPYVDEFVIGRFLAVEPRQVKEMARRGEIPGHPLGRGMRHQWRFRISEIAAALSRDATDSGSTLKLLVPVATRRKQ